MNLKPLPFKHKKKSYEVRAIHEEGDWSIRVFEGDIPLPNITTVKDEVVEDAAASHVKNLLRDLMEMARDDFKRGLNYEISLAIRKLGPKKKRSRN